MNTKQIIQSSANVIRISKLSKGSIYKRFESNYDDRAYYGVVNSIYNDGNNTVIEATEYKYSWKSLEANIKIMTGEKDYILFPTTLEELQNQFNCVVEEKEKEIKDKEKSIEECKKVIDITKRLISGEMQKDLVMADFKEMSQEEYNSKLEELN